MQQRTLQEIPHPLTATESLGMELTRLRSARSLSLRKLARLVGMTAHSGLVDYERGIRVPPDNLFAALASTLSPDDPHLTALYRAAVAERSEQRLTATISAVSTVVAEGAWCERCAPALDELASLLEQLAAGIRARAS